MSNRLIITASIAVAVLLTVSGKASAQSGYKLETFVKTYELKGGYFIKQPGKTDFVAVGAGMFTADVVAAGTTYPGPNLKNTYKAFCSEINQGVSPGKQYVYDTQTVSNVPDSKPMGKDKADLLSQLYAQRMPATPTKKTAQAMQIATWEIVHDTGLNLSAGDFQVKENPNNSISGEVITIAQGYLDTLDPDGARWPLIALTRKYNQDIMIVPETTDGGCWKPQFPALAPEETAGKQEAARGDLNCDGYVDVDDMNTLEAMRGRVAANAKSPNYLRSIADLNGDRTVDEEDARVLDTLIRTQKR